MFEANGTALLEVKDFYKQKQCAGSSKAVLALLFIIIF